MTAGLKALNSFSYNLGDGVYILTKFLDNGDFDGANSIYIEQEVRIEGDTSEVKIILSEPSCFTSNHLRKMADAFDKAAIVAQINQERVTK